MHDAKERDILLQVASRVNISGSIGTGIDQGAVGIEQVAKIVRLEKHGGEIPVVLANRAHDVPLREVDPTPSA